MRRIAHLACVSLVVVCGCHKKEIAKNIIKADEFVRENAASLPTVMTKGAWTVRPAVKSRQTIVVEPGIIRAVAVKLSRNNSGRARAETVEVSILTSNQTVTGKVAYVVHSNSSGWIVVPFEAKRLAFTTRTNLLLSVNGSDDTDIMWDYADDYYSGGYAETVGGKDQSHDFIFKVYME